MSDYVCTGEHAGGQKGKKSAGVEGCKERSQGVEGTWARRQGILRGEAAVSVSYRRCRAGLGSYEWTAVHSLFEKDPKWAFHSDAAELCWRGTNGLRSIRTSLTQPDSVDVKRLLRLLLKEFRE